MVIDLDATDGGDRFLKDFSGRFQAVLPDLALSVFKFENRNAFANGKVLICLVSARIYNLVLDDGTGDCPSG